MSEQHDFSNDESINAMIHRNQQKAIKWNNLNSHISACEECPEVNERHNPRKELGFGYTGKILFIGQNPAASNIEKVKLSNFDHYFRKLLFEANIEKDQYFFTNVIKTSLVKTPINSLTREQLEHCYQHVNDEIELIKPKLTVALGRVAKNYLEKYPKGRTMFLYHPGAIRYGIITEEQYIKKLKQIHKKWETLKNS